MQMTHSHRQPIATLQESVGVVLIKGGRLGNFTEAQDPVNHSVAPPHAFAEVVCILPAHFLGVNVRGNMFGW